MEVLDVETKTIKVLKVSGRRKYKLLDTKGNEIDQSNIKIKLIEEAFIKNKNLIFVDDNNILMDVKIEENVNTNTNTNTNVDLTSDYLDGVLKLKPNNLIISDLNWKFLIRGVVRSKNMMLVGPTGAGKSFTVKSVAEALDRPFFKIPLGSSQDPRATLMGNVGYSKEKGTYFKESEFVKAIQTENAIILLDEYTRAHPEAENILITVLDHQRYLRLDEHEDQISINVAKGVTFIATANIGNEYTTTRIIDRATKDRFLTVEMPYLSKEEELSLLTMKFPKVKLQDLKIITNITYDVRKEYNKEDSIFQNAISTRMAEEIADAVQDGFTIGEAFEITIYPLFDSEGGGSSERTKLKSVIDKYITIRITNNNTNKTKKQLNPNNTFARRLKTN